MIYPDNSQTRERAAQLVAAGGHVAFRTDTFYGLGADPFNAESLGRLRLLKGRDDAKPILVVISDAELVNRFIARPSKIFEALVARHWPGPLTLVVAARDEVPAELTAGTKTVGLRLPDDAEVRALVRVCGGALTATSANLSGEPPGRSAREVESAFGERLPLVIDGGAARSELPSTVLDVSGEAPRLIREGVVTREELGRTLASIGAAFDSRFDA